MKSSVYRPHRKGSAPVFLHARSCGHYIVSEEWRDKRFKKDFLQLFWCVSGKGEFRCGETAWILNPDEVCFYFPGDFHEITPKTSSWEYYWFTADGLDPELLIQTFQVKRTPHFAGKCPEKLFTHLMRELQDPHIRGEFLAGATAYEILSLAMAGNELEENRTLDAFRAMVEDRFSDPETDIETLSNELHIHRSTLTRLVTRQCGMSPVEYLISFRIQEALRLLNDTEYTIKEIASCTGFRNQNYFSKVMVRRLGKTPSELRGTK